MTSVPRWIDSAGNTHTDSWPDRASPLPVTQKLLTFATTTVTVAGTTWRQVLVVETRCQSAEADEESGHLLVLGIGGFHFRAQDPDVLSAWYREHLGVGAGCAAEGTEPADEWTWSCRAARSCSRHS